MFETYKYIVKLYCYYAMHGCRAAQLHAFELLHADDVAAVDGHGVHHLVRAVHLAHRLRRRHRIIISVLLRNTLVLFSPSFFAFCTLMILPSSQVTVAVTCRAEQCGEYECSVFCLPVGRLGWSRQNPPPAAAQYSSSGVGYKLHCMTRSDSFDSLCSFR